MLTAQLFSPARFLLRVKMTSEAFEGKSLIQRHRMVFEVLDEELKATVHALALKLKAPGEAGA